MLTRGTISLVFDDGYEHIYTNIIPLLNKVHIPAVCAVPLEQHIDSTSKQYPVLPWQQWTTIQDHGHELAAHSITHSDLTKLTDEELDKELKLPQQELNATTLVYPGGAHDKRVMKKAQHYYRAARTVKRGFETIPPQNKLQLKTYNFTKRNFSATKANMLAVWAWMTNTWLIETYHIIADHSTERHSVSLVDFTRHIRFINSLPIRKATIRDVCG